MTRSIAKWRVGGWVSDHDRVVGVWVGEESDHAGVCWRVAVWWGNWATV